MTATFRPIAGPAPRPGILDVAPYVGGESKAAGVDRVIRLASNESALGPSPRAVAAYQARAQEIHRYPDGGSTELREALARHHGLDAERIVCGSGSDELIALLVRAYVGPGDEVVYSRHGFLMYPIAARAAGAVPIAAAEKNLTTDVDALLAAVGKTTKVVFLANPNNPTGTYISAEEVARLHAGLPPSVLLVIDAAYAEFVSRNDYEPGIARVDAALANGAGNVVMLRTFSKIYALGGMRLGWAYCSPVVADVLNRVRSPFNVNAAAQAAGVAALADVASVDRAREHNDIWLPWFTRELTMLGLAVNPSVGNFVLVRFPDVDAVFAHLQSRGILTRKMGSYRLPEWLRITIGTEDEMRQVIGVLREFLAR